MLIQTSNAKSMTAASAPDRHSFRNPTAEEVLRSNQREYDDAVDDYWTLTVYDELHGGRRFANLGGRDVLDWIGSRTALTEGKGAVELCSGLADTAVYLSERFGCRVTAVECNHGQVEHARTLLTQRGGAAASRVRLECADVLQWQPGELYDLVYAVDSLMLLPERDRAVRKAREWLVPKGWFAFADVLAGQAISTRTRRFVWKEDGIVGLPRPVEQVEMLRRAGFGCIEWQDLTDIAAARMGRIASASEVHERRLVEIKGRARYRQWVRNARIYREFFESGELVYAQFRARSA